jgi:hypothetical protein
MLKSILSTVQCAYDGPLGATIRHTSIRLRACRFRSASVIGCALMTAYPGKGGGASRPRYSRFECLSSGFAGFTDQWNSTFQGSLGRSLRAQGGWPGNEHDWPGRTARTREPSVESRGAGPRRPAAAPVRGTVTAAAGPGRRTERQVIEPVNSIRHVLDVILRMSQLFCSFLAVARLGASMRNAKFLAALSQVFRKIHASPHSFTRLCISMRNT